MKTYALTVTVGNSIYLACQHLNCGPIQAYCALTTLRPAVPSFIAARAKEVVNSLSMDDLLQTVMAYPGSVTAREAIRVLLGRWIPPDRLAPRLLWLSEQQAAEAGECKPRQKAAVSAFAEIIRSAIQPADSFAPGRRVPPDLDGCDNSSGDATEQVFENVMALVKGKPRHDCAEDLIRRPGFALRHPRVVVTPETKQRLNEVCYALHTGMPIVIRAASGTGKTLMIHIATNELFHDIPLSYQLSARTHCGDLLGRMVRHPGSSRDTFVPGVLTQAYAEGRILLLEGFDLCSPDVLACIVSAIGSVDLEVNGSVIQRHPGFRFVATVNTHLVQPIAEADTEPPTGLAGNLCYVSFPSISRAECAAIFAGLYAEAAHARQIAHMHFQLADYMSGALGLTIRDFYRTISLVDSAGCTVQDACRVGYLARLLPKTRTLFTGGIADSGVDSSFGKITAELEALAKERQLYPHPDFIEAAVHAVVAARAGWHVLLEGASGSGLTVLAEFIAFCCSRCSNAV
jgi:MoxR-like ATPase